MRRPLRHIGTTAAAIVMVASAVAYVAFHERAGLTLPVPWPDELHFILPARAWLEHGSFLTPQLHPDRPLMWMPPGHALVLAEVFRWTGVSLIAARNVSMVFALLAAGCFWAFSRRLAPLTVATVVTALLMLHPAWVVTGNVARMDAMTLALVCGGFAGLQRGWPYAGVSVLFASALVHPNGAVFALSGAIALLLGRRQGRYPARPRGLESIMALLVVVLLTAYAVYALVHLHGFIEDMGFQFQRKANALRWSTFWSPLAWAAYALAVIACLRPYRSRVAWLAALGLPAWWVARVGREMWYHPYDVLFVACFVVAAAVVLLDIGRRFHGKLGRAALLLPIAGVAGLVAWFSAERPRWPSEIRWRRMSVASEPYLDGGAVEAVASRLRDLVPDQAVEFFPRGDAVFFLDESPSAPEKRGTHAAPEERGTHAAPEGSGTIRLVDPVRFDHAARWRVLHESPHHPPHWRKRVAKWLEEAPQERVLLYERSQVDRWWLVPIASGEGEL